MITTHHDLVFSYISISWQCKIVLHFKHIEINHFLYTPFLVCGKN